MLSKPPYKTIFFVYVLLCLFTTHCSSPSVQQNSQTVILKNSQWKTAQIITKYRSAYYVSSGYFPPRISWNIRFGNGSCYKLDSHSGSDIPRKIIETPSAIKLSPDEKTLLFSQDGGLSWNVVFLDVSQRITSHDDPHDAFKFDGSGDYSCEPVPTEIFNHPFFCQHLTLRTPIPDWSAIPNARNIAIDIMRSSYLGAPPRLTQIEHSREIHEEEILMALTYACSHLDDELLQKTLIESSANIKLKRSRRAQFNDSLLENCVKMALDKNSTLKKN